MDKYRNFDELKKNEKEGEDYTVLSVNAGSETAVIAPHGGGIEPGTFDIASSIAGKEFTFYSFKGIKEKDNRFLHISSTKFDEPAGLEIVKNAFIVIAIHGCRDADEIVNIGGKNNELVKRLSAQLEADGFTVKRECAKELAGVNPENICNRCRSGKGVQLEISRGLREKMFKDFRTIQPQRKLKKFYSFVSSVRKTLLDTQ